MSKVVVVFEDLASGKVKIKCEPSMEVLMKAMENEHIITPAEGYAYHALMTVWKAAKSLKPLEPKLPKILRS
jgi:hypothetical protein